MGLWSKKESHFMSLDSAEELSRLFELSNEKPVVIFKHSSLCPISADAYEEMLRFENDINLVVVQTAREISNEIESRTGITHESPQVIILRNGKPVWHSSHWHIKLETVTEAFQKA